jgi:hypothetical protein
MPLSINLQKTKQLMNSTLGKSMNPEEVQKIKEIIEKISNSNIYQEFKNKLTTCPKKQEEPVDLAEKAKSLKRADSRNRPAP